MLAPAEDIEATFARRNVVDCYPGDVFRSGLDQVKNDQSSKGESPPRVGEEPVKRRTMLAPDGACRGSHGAAQREVAAGKEARHASC